MEKRGVIIQQMFEDLPSNSLSNKDQGSKSEVKKDTRFPLSLMSLSSASDMVKSSESVIGLLRRKKSMKRQSTASITPNKLTPSAAVAKYGHKLTPYEHNEIKDYPAVYCLGLNAQKLNAGTNPSRDTDIYDDEDHFYKIVPKDHIAYRYEIAEKPVLGKGTFGQVVKVYDHKLHKYVALKMVRNERIYLKQSREELRILQALKRQDPDGINNIVLLGMNLYQVLKKNNYHGIGMSRILPIAKCVVKCLELLFRNRIIHCDLKPENIMLRKNGDFSSVKVGDFGSSCYEQQQVYHYIQSRYYRAPEVILGMRYGPAIDMWSFGCVLGELSVGLPIFVGADEEDQLAAMEEVLGEVPPSLRNRSRPKTRSGKRRKARGLPGTKVLSSLVVGDEAFKDMIRLILEWDPALRPTPIEIQDHFWFNRSAMIATGLKGSTHN